MRSTGSARQAGHVGDVQEDCEVAKVRILDLFRVGSFGKVYRGIMTNSTSMEVAVKKVPVDQMHKSREEYFANVLKSPYIV